MREYKFRAWHNGSNQMLYEEKPGKVFEWQYQPIEIMQYTGLHDKNGKEIYEGDILTLWRSLSVSGEPRGEYWTPLPVVYEPLWCQFVVEDKANKDYHRMWQDFDAFEVIGNIYENPELLEVGQ